MWFVLRSVLETKTLLDPKDILIFCGLVGYFLLLFFLKVVGRFILKTHHVSTQQHVQSVGGCQSCF